MTEICDESCECYKLFFDGKPYCGAAGKFIIDKTCMHVSKSEDKVVPDIEFKRNRQYDYSANFTSLDVFGEQIALVLHSDYTEYGKYFKHQLIETHKRIIKELELEEESKPSDIIDWM
jgi:hypothetical protein